jgi:hypothetical protein
MPLVSSDSATLAPATWAENAARAANRVGWFLHDTYEGAQRDASRCSQKNRVSSHKRNALPQRARARPRSGTFADADRSEGRNFAALKLKGAFIMGRGILLWLLGVPIPIILLLAMCSHS